jgi:ABC-type transport system involved in cytochrome c biogenesis permease subunit
MNDLSFFWIAFGSYLAGSLALAAATVRRGSDRLAATGRGLVWLGLAAQTTSIVWRAFLVGTEPLGQFFPRMSAAFASGPAWQATVYVLVFAVLVLAGVLALVFRRRRIVWLLTLGAAVLVELILLDFLDFTRLPIEKVYEYLNIAAWCAAIGMLAVSPLVRLTMVDAALALTASLLTVYAAIQPKNIQLQLVPALQSYWLFIHVSLTSVAYAIFAVAFAIAALFIVKTFDPASVSRGAKRRTMLSAVAATAVAIILVLVVVQSGLTLPREEVAFTPHEVEIAKGKLPDMELIHVVRYGAALIGAVATTAFVLFWLVAPFLHPKDDRSGLGAFAFVTSSIALSVACLTVAGVVQRQEKAIGALYEQRRELHGLMQAHASESGSTLAESTARDDIAHWRKQAKQARAILRARWLPLTLDKQATLGDDELFRSLQTLYTETGTEWKLPIRYKDIKQIGRDLNERADIADAVLERVALPASHAELNKAVADMLTEVQSREAAALLPRRAVGMLATFVGYSFLLAIPLTWFLAWLFPRLRDRLPEAKRLDGLSYGAIAVAYPIFTFGAIFAGAIWAHFAWGVWWSWDPKEVGSLIAWVLYSLYLHQRYREGMTPRNAAVAGMLGFLAATLCLAGNNFLGGLHAYS